MNRALATTSSGDKSASTPLIRGAGGLALSVHLRNSYIVSIYCILIGFYVPFVLSLFHEKHLLCHMNRPISKISRSAERIVADAKLVNSTYFL